MSGGGDPGDLDLDALFAQHRPRLLRMVDVRLEPGLRRRVDVDDVVQEVYAEATARLPQYIEAPAMPFFLWLRFLCSQKIAELYRRHVGAQGTVQRVSQPRLSGQPRRSRPHAGQTL